MCLHGLPAARYGTCNELSALHLRRDMCISYRRMESRHNPFPCSVQKGHTRVRKRKCKRSFGMRLAWVVLVLDLCKAAVVVSVFASLFERTLGLWQLGAAYTGFIAVLGHAFPIWYGFKGGKGFLVGLSTVYVIDWRVGLIATLIMIVLLFTTKYMSLSTVTAMLCCPILLALFGAARPTVLIEAATVLFIALRHKENFKRLVAGTESKFALGSH